MSEINDVVLTFDVDWSPDFAIEKTAKVLIDNKVKATWFITHNSKATQQLFKYPNLFEIGIHPNFMPNTTQGNNQHEVMKYVLNIAPNAKAVRTHCMVYSAGISRMFAVDFGLEIDCCNFMGEMPNLIPYEVFYGDKVILRMPNYWSDDGELSIKQHPSFSSESKKFSLSGLKILAFHPIHIFLNSAKRDNYNTLKSKYDIKNCEENDVKPFINSGVGSGSLLKEVIASNPNPDGFKTISEIADLWRKHESY